MSEPPSHYRSNVRDLEFALFELLGRGEVLGAEPWEALDPATARAALREVARLAEHDLAPAATAADRTPPVLDPDTGLVSVGDAMQRAYRAYRDSGWWRLDLPAELGGTPCPPSLRWAVQELVLGANPAIHMYGCGSIFASVIHELGTPQQQQLASLMVEHGWGAAMLLTEAEAGSDVGAARTRAVPAADGTWHLDGVKRFITNGDHDLADTIVHLVLARPEGAEPGTKGLSLFIVPKHHLDPATGEPGERNGVRVAALEQKMGLHASATCEVVLGADSPAVGTLLGDRHDGIAQMFRLVEDARMMVGTKAMATLSTAHLNAAELARTRLQGPELARRRDPAAPRVPIVRHPDVRRMLLTTKAQAEGLRALVLLTAASLDDARLAAHRGNEVAADTAAARAALLLPVVKGYGSERACALLADTMQVAGGSGYLRDLPFERYLRDTKVDTLYEGTTGIQGLDLFFRKIVRDDGAALDLLLDEVLRFALDDDASFVAERAELALATDDLRAVVRTLTAWNDPDRGIDIDRVGENTTRLLMMLGDVVVAWLLLRSAQVAEQRLIGIDAGEPLVHAGDRDFYAGKVAAARWFARTRLPGVTAERAIVEATDDELAKLPDTAF